MTSRSFIATLNRISREADRRAKEQQRAVRAAEREAAASLRREHRLEQLSAKEERERYVAERQLLVDKLNTDLADNIYAISNALRIHLDQFRPFKIESLKRRLSIEDTLKSRQDLLVIEPPVKEKRLPRKLGLFAGLVPGARAKHAARIAEQEATLEAKYTIALQKHAAEIRQRDHLIEAATAEIDAFNADVDAFAASTTKGDPESVCRYFVLVFDELNGTNNLKRGISCYNGLNFAYEPTSKHLIIDCELPMLNEIIPSVESYKYVKSNDTVTERKRPDKDSRQLYNNLIASAALIMINAVFRNDEFNAVSVFTLNAFIRTIDSSTGRPIHPCVLSARTSADTFSQLDLKNVDPSACLKGLSASVSRSPSELIPVKPIVDINMVDARFIKERDIISQLDNRTNLMTLTPSEFESLITNLFQKMGLETKLTLPSRDGGVDCVAFDQRPILGGKVVIQAKRYKNTVGVSSVRDLFGTMMNEGASKGILVSTSGYGKASFEFANGKPLELITGENLLYLLKEVADIEAKIEPPDDWVDFRE